MSKKDRDKKERDALLKKLDQTLKQVDESQLASPPSLGQTALSGMLTFLAAAFIAWMFSGSPQPQLPNTDPTLASIVQHSNLKHGNIPIVTLPRPTVSFFSKQINLTAPSIFRGTVVDTWRARSTWTFESLLQRSEVVNHHLLSLWDSCELRSEAETSVDGLTELLDALSEVDVPQREHLDWKSMLELGKDVHSHRCASVRMNIHRNLINEIQPIAQLYTPAAASTETVVRIDTSHIIDPLQYYPGYRFYVQMSGEANVVLVPASQHDKIHLFPSVTSFNQQSQISLWSQSDLSSTQKAPTLNVQPKNFPKLTNADLFEARLVSGDLLAIPPYWLSSFITVRPSVSILFSSETEAQQSAASIRSLPFESLLAKIIEDSNVTISRPTASYLLALNLDFLRGDFDKPFPHFIKELIEERYMPLLGETDAEVQFCGIQPDSTLPTALAPDIEGIVSSHTEFFYSLDYSVQMTILKDVMERLAAHSDPQHLVRTLKCWATLDLAVA